MRCGVEADPLFGVAGEMARRMAAFDWERTSLGRQEDWPSGLRVLTRVVLSSPAPMWITWGSEGSVLYNDACAALALGARHPWALGRPAAEAWGERWQDIQKNAARRSDKNAAGFAVPFLVDRDGGTAEVYLGFSCAPVPHESNELATAGSLWVVTDHTQAVLSQRRLRLPDALTRTTSPAASDHSRVAECARAAEQVSTETARVEHTLGAIGHELRAPLNAILAWSQILAGGVTPADQRRGLETITRSARAQAQLLDRLLDHGQVSLPPPPPVVAQASGVPDLADLVILVVDDEDDAREATARTLSLAGAAVIEAGSAREGWARLEEQPVALILSDISMPDVDGYAFMLGARNRPDLTGGMAPAIALTSRGGSVDRQQALRAGFQMHLTKPVESTELILACASLTGRLVPH